MHRFIRAVGPHIKSSSNAIQTQDVSRQRAIAETVKHFFAFAAGVLFGAALVGLLIAIVMSIWQQ